jgi:hypothetical protein
MKSRLPLSLFAVFAFFCLPVTRKPARRTDGAVPVGGDFYATIDGNQWNADSVQQILVSSDGVTITGTSKTGAQISMILPEFKTVHSQSIRSPWHMPCILIS